MSSSNSRSGKGGCDKEWGLGAPLKVLDCIFVTPLAPHLRKGARCSVEGSYAKGGLGEWQTGLQCNVSLVVGEHVGH